MSRVYPGIHWIFEQQDGITLGNRVDQYVAANHFTAIPEPSSPLIAGLCQAGLSLWKGQRKQRY